MTTTESPEHCPDRIVSTVYIGGPPDKTNDHASDNSTITVTSSSDCNNSPVNPERLLRTLEDDYKYVREDNHEAANFDVRAAATFATLKNAVMSLTPRRLQVHVYSFRDSMREASKAIEKQHKWCIKSGEAGFLHPKVRNLNKRFSLQPGSVNDGEDQLDNCAVAKEVETLGKEFQRSVTKKLYLADQTRYMQLVVARIRTFFKELISLAEVHTLLFRFQQHDNNNDDSLSPLDKTELAKVAIKVLLDKLDLQMLEYLHVGRDKLVEEFQEQHKPVQFANLNNADDEVVMDVANVILTYVKHATCFYNKEMVQHEKKREGYNLINAYYQKKDQEDRKRRQSLLESQSSPAPRKRRRISGPTAEFLFSTGSATPNTNKGRNSRRRSTTNNNKRRKFTSPLGEASNNQKQWRFCL